MLSNRKTSFATALQTFMRVLGALLGAVATGFLARGLGTTGFGWFATTLAVAGVSTLASDLGLMQVATREIVERPDQTVAIAKATVRVRFLLALPVTALASLVLLPQPPSLRPASALLLLTIPVSSLNGFQAVLQAEKRLASIGMASLVQSVVWTAGAASCWAFGLPASSYGVVFLSAAALQGLEIRRAAFACSDRRSHDKNARLSVRQLLRSSGPIGLGAFFWSAMQRSPLVIAATVAGASQGALVGAAARIADALYLLPSTVAGLLLPLFTERAQDTERQQRVTDSAIGLALFSGTVMLTCTVISAPALGNLIFGRRLAGFPLVAVLVVAAVVPFFLDCVWGSAAIARGDGELMARSGLKSLIVAVAAGVPLSLEFGAVGASIALVLAQSVRATLLGMGSRSTVGCGSARRWTAGVVTLMLVTALAALATAEIQNPERLVVAIVGSAVAIPTCGLISWITGLVRREDLTRAGVLQPSQGVR